LSITLYFPEPSDPHADDLKYFRPLIKLESPVDRIFGNKFEGGQLFFRDARLENEPPYGFQKTQARICKYRKLGTAKDKHLFSTEYAAPMSFKTIIEGHHRGLINNMKEDLPFEYCLLIAGIMNITHLGGDKSTGCGKTDVLVDSIQYNEKTVPKDTVFEYLELPEYYLDVLETEANS
jgi:hypothetical protein